jgi:hypothetical protein
MILRWRISEDIPSPLAPLPLAADSAIVCAVLFLLNVLTLNEKKKDDHSESLDEMFAWGATSDLTRFNNTRVFVFIFKPWLAKFS